MSVDRRTKLQNSFWIESRAEEDMGQFSAGPINSDLLNPKGRTPAVVSAHPQLWSPGGYTT